MDSQRNTEGQPMLSSMRIMLYVASILVFLIGIPLFLLTEQTELYFAWTIQSALTAAFLGGAYWSSFALEFLAARKRLWTNARVAVPAVLIFTTLTLVITLIHLDRFHFTSPEWYTRYGTWAWLIVYAAVPVILGSLWVAQSSSGGASPPRRALLPDWIQAFLVFQALIMIPLGIGLLVAPSAVAPLWPWGLTPLTGRAIGAWLTGIGVAAAHAAWEDDLERTHASMVSYFVLALLQAIALVRYPGEVNWAAPQAWAYVYLLTTIGIVGLGGWLAARAHAQRAQEAGEAQLDPYRE